MNVILDYDSGNLDSVLRGFLDAGIDSIISKEVPDIKEATSLVLPGVGAFGDAMDALKKSGLIPLIKEHVKQEKFLFGICLGMQLLYEKGYEHGVFEGLGLIHDSVKYLDIEMKVPHMGWNQLSFFKPQDPILSKIKENDHVYFVHSYYVESNHEELVSYTMYETLIPAIVRKNNIYGTQFHPEKSGSVGARILQAYKEILDDYLSSD